MTARDLLVATPSQTVGPFFHLGLTPRDNGRLADRLPTGHPVTLLVTVTDGEDQAVADAVVELAQIGVVGRMATGESGSCEFTVMRPGSTEGDSAGVRAPHLHVCLFARGLLRHLHTRIYFADDPAIEHDAALGLVPVHRRGTLLARADPGRADRWIFDLRLQGPQETVFFDG